MLCAVSGAFAADPGSARYVEVKLTKLRSGPQAWAAAKKELAFGTAVTVLEVAAGWSRVQLSDGAEGFVHNSALTAKKVVFQATAAGAGGLGDASNDPSGVVLAGKGFNRDVEASYQKSVGQVSFDKVEALEKMKVPDRDLEAFVAAGCLGAVKKGKSCV